MQLEGKLMCLSRVSKTEHSDKDITFQRGRHLEPLREPLSTLAATQTIRIDPPDEAGLSREETSSRVSVREKNAAPGEETLELTEPRWAADLSHFRVVQLMRAQPAESPVQQQQLPAVAVEAAANQEARQAWREEQQRAEASLRRPGQQKTQTVRH